MYIAGLTGGAGCGKSTFRKFFCEISGAHFLDADQIVRELMDHDTAIRVAITSQFSTQAYDEHGRPDRAWLRLKIYQEPDARHALEAILHPAVRRIWQATAQECRRNQQSLVVEIPLLFEKKLETEFDFSILVAASPQTQHQRLAQRGLDPTTARNLLAAQLPTAEKIPRASQVIWNDGSLAFLHAQAETLSQQFHRTYGN